jgi:uncharacterized protein
MPKSKLIYVFYFVICVILGLLFSNFLLIIMLYLRQGSFLDTLSNADSIIHSLNRYDLLVSQMTSQVFSLIIPAWIYSKLTASDGISLNRREFSGELLFISCLFFLSAIPFVALSAYLNNLIPLADWMKHSELQMSAMIEKMLVFQHSGDLVIALIVIAIIPAIAEEWVFRGIIQNLFIEWTHKKYLGVILASIVFSSIHFQFQGFLPRLLLGFILGLVYLKTSNLWYPILLHFFNNGTQVIGVYFYRDEVLKQINNQVELPGIPVFLISLAVLAVSIYMLFQRTKDPAHAQT